MKKRWVIITLIILVSFGVTVFALNKKSRTNIEVKTAKAQNGDLVASFSTNGALEAKSKRDYYVQTPTKVTKVRVKIGDNVKKGDILVEFEVQDMSIQLKTAEKQYENAKINLSKTKEAYNKQKEQKNQEQLPTASGISASSLSQSQITENDIKLQENQVEIARLNVESIKQNISKQQKNIKADIDGTISVLNAVEGSMTSVQMPVVSVENTSELQGVLNVNQYDIANIKEGQEASVKFNNQAVKAQVERINPTATRTVSPTGSDTTIKVILNLLEANNQLKPGFEVDVDVKVGEKKNVLKIPAEAVITDKDGNEKAYIVENGIAKLKNIRTGLTSDIEVEVLEGLNSGDKVILNPATSLKDGILVVEKDVK